MSTSQLSTQPAAVRRSAEAELRGLIAEFAPAHHGMADLGIAIHLVIGAKKLTTSARES